MKSRFVFGDLSLSKPAETMPEFVAQLGAAFPISGNPSTWDGFADLPQPLQDLLVEAFASWQRIYPIEFGFGETVTFQ